MNKTLRTSILALLVFTFVFGGIYTVAQDQGRDRGNRRFNPEQMQQMIMERMKDQLNASNDEWLVIQPRLLKVWDLQRETSTRGFGRGFMRPPRRPGDDANRGGRRGFGPEPSPEEQALETVLENENAAASDIKAKLDALRKARQAKEAELNKARNELRQVLTVRQEAQLVLFGTLD